MVVLAPSYAAFLIIIFLRADSDTWAILVIPTLPLLPLAYIVHRGNLGWIRIQEQKIEIVPSWFHRRFWGEQSKNARFDSDSELLFCRRFAYSALDGFFVLLRSHPGADQTLWSTTATTSGAGRRWWSRIAQEISSTHNLRTRLIEQTVSSQGMSETDWKTGQGKMLWQGLKILIVPAISPWLGIGARVLTGDPSKLVLFGVLLWIGAGASFWYWFRVLRAKPPQDLTAGIWIFTLQFATFYTMAVLVTGALLRH
jgi:hypothetical protein